MKKRILSAICAAAMAVSMVGAPIGGSRVFNDTAITASANAGDRCGDLLVWYMGEPGSGPNGSTRVGVHEYLGTSPTVILPNDPTITGFSQGLLHNKTIKNLVIPRNYTYMEIVSHDIQTYEETAKRITIYCYAGSEAESICKKGTYKYKLLSDSLPDSVAGIETEARGRNALKLKWDTVNGADGYVVYKYNAVKKGYEAYGATRTNSKMISGLNAGTTYAFCVRSFKTVGGKNYYSPHVYNYYSSTLPENVTGLKAAKTGMSAIYLTWNKVSGASGYTTYKYDPDAKKFEVYRLASTNSQMVTDLKPGTSYIFTVRAFKMSDINNTLGTYSYIHSPGFTNYKTSTCPSNVTFAAASTAKGNCYIRWNQVNGATGYRLYYKPTASSSWQVIGNVSAKIDRFTKTGLTSGSTGYFTVRAIRVLDGRNFASPSFYTKAVKIK